jgi:hypothetical protein
MLSLTKIGNPASDGRLCPLLNIASTLAAAAKAPLLSSDINAFSPDSFSARASSV